MAHNYADQPLTATLPATGQTGTHQAYTQAAYLYPGGPLTGATSYDESGSPVRSATYTYTATGELAAEGGSAEPLTATYDALHRPLTIADGNGNVTTYFYDPRAGSLAQICYPGAGTPSAPLAAGTPDTVTFGGYNGNGDPASSTDGRGVTTTYTYGGPGGALSSAVTSSTGSVAARTITLSYAPGPTTGFGRLSSVSDSGNVSHTYSYDDDDDLTADITSYAGGPSNTLSYSHYPDGSLDQMTASVVGGAGYTYTYDAAGRLGALKDPNGQTDTWTWQANDWPATQTLGDGATSFYTYNGAGQLTDLSTRQTNSNTSALLSEFGPITYNGAGDIASVAQDYGSTSYTTSYGYNSLDRLTSETNSPAAYPALGAITYDGAGNRTGATYNADNQSAANTYDGDGNPTTYGGRPAAFDALDQMTQFGSLLTAGYDPSGLRAWKQSAQTGGGKAYTFYDGADPVAETTSSGTLLSVNTFGPTGLLSSQTGSGETFYAFDARGNVAQRLGGGGSVSSSDAYNAYGQKLSGNPGGDEFGFGGQAGYRTDPETGLCLLGQRYYDPAAGRFLTRDPAGYAGGMDLYAYCGDDPVDFMDPMGLDYDDGDPNTPNTFGGWIDHFGFNDSVNNLGTTVGEADAGCATLGDELLAGGKVAGYGALLFVPGGEEARGAEIGANLLDDGARDLAEDAARGCGKCLAAGTLVAMADGSSEPIQDIRAGDRVLSRDPQTGQDAVKTVTATVQRPADALVTLSLSDGQSGKTERITCTPEHPLYVSGKGWVEAGDLGVGTSLVTRAGLPLTVTDVDWQRDQTGQHPFTVYNLTVEGDHTYFAGDLDGGLWAHNQCGIDLDAASQAGRVADKNLFTRAGRALQKHTSPGRTFGYSAPLDKTAKGYNEAGQQVLDDILTDPNGVATGRVHQIYGAVHEIMTPRGGVRLGASNYHFYGFLDP